MKKRIEKRGALLPLLAIVMLLCSLPAWADDQEYKKKKEINQSYDISMSDLLQVDNRYGNITIAYWSKSEAAFRVVIESKSNNEKRAQEEIDRIKVEFKKSNGIVSAITNMEDRKGSWSWGSSNNSSVTIHYYINIPNGMAMNLEQMYGNIELPANNEGKCQLTVKYGNLFGGNFKAPLTVAAKYSNVTVGDVNQANFEVGYAGNVKVGNANTFTIDSKYSNLTIQSAKQLNVEKKYGSLKVDKAERVRLDMKYSDATFQSIEQSLEATDVSYGNLTVNRMSGQFEKVQVSARYGNLNLGIPANAAFTVAAESMKYGNVSVNGFTITSSEKSDKSEYHSVINNGTQRTVQFNGNGYGSLKVFSY